VDATLVVLALSYLKDARRALDEMSRVLKPGGRAVVVDLLRHDREQFRIEMGQTSRGFSRDELHDLLAESGLQRVSCRPLAPEADAKGPALLLATAVTSEAPAAADDHPNTLAEWENPQGTRVPFKVRLAEQEMPGLMSLREAYAGKAPLKGAKIMGSLHMTVQTAVLIETLTNSAPTCAGCRATSSPRRITPAAVVAAGSGGTVDAPKGTPVFAWKGETLEEYWWCTRAGADLARWLGPESAARRRRRRDAARAQRHRIREGRQ
jgi:hypothetical protein